LRADCYSGVAIFIFGCLLFLLLFVVVPHLDKMCCCLTHVRQDQKPFKKNKVVGSDNRISMDRTMSPEEAVIFQRLQDVITKQNDQFCGDWWCCLSNIREIGKEAAALESDRVRLAMSNCYRLVAFEIDTTGQPVPSQRFIGNKRESGMQVNLHPRHCQCLRSCLMMACFCCVTCCEVKPLITYDVVMSEHELVEATALQTFLESQNGCWVTVDNIPVLASCCGACSLCANHPKMREFERLQRQLESAAHVTTGYNIVKSITMHVSSHPAKVYKKIGKLNVDPNAEYLSDIQPQMIWGQQQGTYLHMPANYSQQQPVFVPTQQPQAFAPQALQQGQPQAHVQLQAYPQGYQQQQQQQAPQGAPQVQQSVVIQGPPGPQSVMYQGQRPYASQSLQPGQQGPFAQGLPPMQSTQQAYFAQQPGVIQAQAQLVDPTSKQTNFQYNASAKIVPSS
jgi:hypothetical protein